MLWVSEVCVCVGGEGLEVVVLAQRAGDAIFILHGQPAIDS